jgi:hypothetical protein
MKLINCPACSKQISPDAESCPHCGNPIKPKQSFGYVLGVLVILVILIWALLDILHSQSALDGIK